MNSLRLATRADHQAAERCPISVAMVRGEVIRDDYRLVLASYERLLLALEQRLERLERSRPELASVLAVVPRRSRALAADLAALGRSALPPALECVLCHWQAALLGAAYPDWAVLGWCYVFEGSMLGARVILPRLKRALGAELDAYRYYSGDGEATRERWETLGSRLNALQLEPEQIELALDGARAAFTAVREALDSIPCSLEPVRSLSHNASAFNG